MGNIIFSIVLVAVFACCYLFGVGAVQFFQLDTIFEIPIGLVAFVIIFIIFNIIFSGWYLLKNYQFHKKRFFNLFYFCKNFLEKTP